MKIALWGLLAQSIGYPLNAGLGSRVRLQGDGWGKIVRSEFIKKCLEGVHSITFPGYTKIIHDKHKWIMF